MLMMIDPKEDFTDIGWIGCTGMHLNELIWDIYSMNMETASQGHIGGNPGGWGPRDPDLRMGDSGESLGLHEYYFIL